MFQVFAEPHGFPESRRGQRGARPDILPHRARTLKPATAKAQGGRSPSFGKLARMKLRHTSPIGFSSIRRVIRKVDVDLEAHLWLGRLCPKTTGGDLWHLGIGDGMVADCRQCPCLVG